MTSSLSPFLKTVALALEPHLDKAREEGLFCALSGGADSVALLLALQELGIALTALHCNFHLRGEESDADEHFVKQLCKQHSIPLEIRHFDTKKEAAQKGESIEMAARRLRYEWFAQQAQPVAVAHHADDNVETLLLNLLRGTGLRGLTGMQSDNGRGILRPFLQLQKTEILHYLQERGVSHRVDSSNRDTRFKRNAIRHNLLPVLQQLNPKISDTLQATTQRLQAQCEVYELGLSLLHRRWTPSVAHGKRLYPLPSMLQEPRLAHTYLFEQLSPLGFESSSIEQMLSARIGALFETPTHQACISWSGLEIFPRSLPPLPTVEIKEVECDEHFRVSRSSVIATLDRDSLKGKLYLRYPSEGDRFTPYGMPRGSRLLSDYLTDRHLSRLERQRTPLLCDAEGIVWVVGHTIAQRCAITDHTRHIVQISHLPSDCSIGDS